LNEPAKALSVKGLGFRVQFGNVFGVKGLVLRVKFGNVVSVKGLMLRVKFGNLVLFVVSPTVFQSYSPIVL
jgi:hypothetical protein